MNPKPEYIYIAFDVFPSQKGAATHINHCLKALQNTFNSGLLICLGTDDMPAFQFDKERNLYVFRFKEKIANFLKRTEQFQIKVNEVLNLPLCSAIKLVQFRDIWGGIPILQHKATYKTVFEVNAFQHIELPNRYPNISERVIEKIKVQEQYCMSHADAIITPSQVTQSFIYSNYNIKNQSVNVIPNGVTIVKTTRHNSETNNQTPYLLYFGAVQKWQGIKTLFKALKELNDLDIRLLICASVPKKRTLIYHELAESIGVAHQIDWLYQLDKQALAQKIINAKISIAPLLACNRNSIQGCNPLKIIESMAYGIPVVASNLAVVKEIIDDNDTGFLVTPDRPELLGRKIRALLEQPKTLKQVADKGKQKIKKNYLWMYQESKMKNIYQNLLNYV